MENREIALKWWKNLGSNPLDTIIKQGELVDIYYPNRIRSSLTGREIENIFDTEVNKKFNDLDMFYDFSKGVALSDDVMS